MFLGIASLDVVCDELNGCAWNDFCSSFLISVCMFIVSKALLISSATVIVRTGGGGGIWLKFDMFALCKEEGFSPLSLQLLRGGILACMRCPCLCLCNY